MMKKTFCFSSRPHRKFMRSSLFALGCLSVILVSLLAAALRTAVADDDRPDRWRSYKELTGSLEMRGGDNQAQMGLLTDINSSVQVQGKFVLKQTQVDDFWGKVEFTGRLEGTFRYGSSMKGVNTKEFASKFESICSGPIGPDSEVTLHVFYKEGTYTLDVAAPGQCNNNTLQIKEQGQRPVDIDLGEEILITVSHSFDVLRNGGLPLPKSGKSFSGQGPVLMVAGFTNTPGTGQWWINTIPTDVSMDGCVELAETQVGTVTAQGRPPGGTYQYTANPSSVVRVDGNGSTAKVTAVAPGHASVDVDYVAPGGQHSRASLPAVSLRVESINGGAPVAPIGLYDVDLKRKSALVRLPVSIRPVDAENLLSYHISNPAVLSISGEGNAILLQGLSPGKTTVQAQTKCGGPTGPSLAVELVRCDEEVLATLERILEQARENLREDLKRVDEILSDPAFQKAAREIKLTTIRLAASTASVTVTATTTAAGAGASHTVHAAEKLVGDLSSLIESFAAGHEGNLSGVTKASGMTLARHLADAEQSQRLAVTEAYELGELARELGEQLGELIGTEKKMEQARKQVENSARVIEMLVGKLTWCRTGDDATAEPPPTEPPPNKPEPPVKSSQPPAPPQEPPATPGEPPVPQDPSTSGNTDLPPPQPGPAPPPVGLPYQPDDRGCSRTAELAPNSSGLALLGTGLSNLKTQVDDFTSGLVAGYQQDLNSLPGIFSEVQAATAAPADDQAAQLAAPLSRLTEVRDRLQRFGTEAQIFGAELEKCPESVDAGLSVMRSAMEIQTK